MENDYASNITIEEIEEGDDDDMVIYQQALDKGITFDGYVNFSCAASKSILCILISPDVVAKLDELRNAFSLMIDEDVVYPIAYVKSHHILVLNINDARHVKWFRDPEVTIRLPFIKHTIGYKNYDYDSNFKKYICKSEDSDGHTFYLATVTVNFMCAIKQNTINMIKMDTRMFAYSITIDIPRESPDLEMTKDISYEIIDAANTYITYGKCNY